MKRAFMSIKFYPGDVTKKKIKDITEALKKASIENFVLVRDVEKYGEVHLKDSEIMPRAFIEMEKSDMLIVEFSEKGVGLGIGAGYAYAKNIPIYVIAKTGSDISSTINGLAKEVMFYDKPEELTEKFKKLDL